MDPSPLPPPTPPSRTRWAVALPVGALVGIVFGVLTRSPIGGLALGVVVAFVASGAFRGGC